MNNKLSENIVEKSDFANSVDQEIDAFKSQITEIMSGVENPMAQAMLLHILRMGQHSLVIRLTGIANMFSKTSFKVGGKDLPAEIVPSIEINDQILMKPLREIEGYNVLSNRTKNTFVSNGLEVMGDVILLSEKELLFLKNVGSVTLYEIQGWLAINGMQMNTVLTDEIMGKFFQSRINDNPTYLARRPAFIREEIETRFLGKQ